MKSDCPYGAIPETQFWRSLFAAGDAANPHAGETPRFKLDRKTKIATAGSCFAQHISRHLQGSGYRYFVTEAGPEDLSPEDRLRRNYGVFSARFGNIYTARHLLQLAQQALGQFTPREEPWTENGRFFDPYRPSVEPEGFDSLESLERDRSAHLLAVRRLLSEVDVLVFTLGLTETWLSRTDGAAFPVCPGCSRGTFDAEKYAFHNHTVAEVTQDLTDFLTLLRGVNPAARVILTVSPVPLVATYEPRSALISTTASKAILRAAADEVVRSHGNVAYFGSYEIITGTFRNAAFYGADRRSITPDGVSAVMGCFLNFLGEKEDAADFKSILRAAGIRTGTVDMPDRSETVCDEESVASYLGAAALKRSSSSGSP